MATTFKKQFIANGLIAHVIKRKSGKNTFCYEIRYRSNGFCISAASTNLNTAKARFLEKTTPPEIQKYRVSALSKTQNYFFSVFEEWLHSLLLRLAPLRNRRRNASRR